jgi:hypothetical protein
VPPAPAYQAPTFQQQAPTYQQPRYNTPPTYVPTQPIFQ